MWIDGYSTRTTMRRDITRYERLQLRKELEQKHRKLSNRLHHAQIAADNWPTTNRQCELFHIEREIEHVYRLKRGLAGAL